MVYLLELFYKSSVFTSEIHEGQVQLQKQEHELLTSSASSREQARDA